MPVFLYMYNLHAPPHRALQWKNSHYKSLGLGVTAWESVSSGHFGDCSFHYIQAGFIFHRWRLLLDCVAMTTSLKTPFFF